jgi:DNA-binding MarR family transcriptional regulator
MTATETRPPGNGRGRRRRPAEPWEREVLCLVSEQGAIPVDQLARFLGVDGGAAGRIATHLREVGYLRWQRILADEPPWLWLTYSGMKAVDNGLPELHLRVGALPRLRLVNEVRLHIAEREPTARWTSARQLWSRHGRAFRAPAGVVSWKGERHSMDVITHYLLAEWFSERVAHRSATYDAVVYFCPAALRKYYAKIAEANDFSRLVLKPMPEAG